MRFLCRIDDYRFGFNGKEKDENQEWGDLTHYDYGFRIYNPGIGKFLSQDPLRKDFPWNSPYAFAENDVISSIDLEGAEKLRITMRAFIPYHKVALDVTHATDATDYQLHVHGDGPRRFIYDLAAAGYGPPGSGNEGYRVEYLIDLDLDKDAGSSPLVGRDYRTGESSIYFLNRNGDRNTWTGIEDSRGNLWTGYAGDNEIKYSADGSPLTDNSNFRSTRIDFSTLAVRSLPLAARSLFSCKQATPSQSHDARRSLQLRHYILRPSPKARRQS